MSFFSSNPFYDMLERATSENIPGAEEDIVLNLDIADLIKSKKIKADEAVNAMKKKLDNSNPNVQLLTIKLLDCCIKNSGNHFLAKVSQKEIVDSMATIIRSSLTNPELKKVALTYFQNWAIAFRTKPDLYYLPSVYNELKREGYRFPAYNSSEVSGALIDTETAPEWSDSSVCMRCRTSFTTFNRKHHCRKCGMTFCNDCCNKRIPLPSLGITDPERVCESCYNKVTNPTYNTPPNQSSPNIDFNDKDFFGASDYIDSFDRHDNISSREEDDIKRAIELSLKEAENANQSRTFSSNNNNNNNRSRTFTAEEQPENSDEEEEQLRKAIEASLKDIKISENTNTTTNESNIVSDNPDELLTTEIENIKLFSQLMEKINAEAPVKGVQAINDTQIQALHVQISELYPKVMKNKNYYEEKYKKFNDIHEKLILATKLYDKILSQRINAARPGSLYSSSLYQPSPSVQQPYVYNSYSVPPASMPQHAIPSREGSVDPQTQPAYISQYPTYPPASQPPVNYSQPPLASVPPSQPSVNYAQPPSQPPQTVAVQPQPPVPGQDLALQQPQMIPPQQVPLQQMPPQAPPAQAPVAQAPVGQAPPAQAPVAQVPQPMANPQDMKTMPYGTEYVQPGAAAPYAPQPYLTMQQPNVVPEAQQAQYGMPPAPVPVVQQAPPPEPVEEKPLIEL